MMRTETAINLAKQVFDHVFLEPRLNTEFLEKIFNKDGKILIINPGIGLDINYVDYHYCPIVDISFTFNGLNTITSVPEPLLERGSVVLQGTRGSVLMLPRKQGDIIILESSYNGNIVQFIQEIHPFLDQDMLSEAVAKKWLTLAAEAKVELRIPEDFDSRLDMVKKLANEEIEKKAKLMALKEINRVAGELAVAQREIDRLEKELNELRAARYGVLNELTEYVKQGWKPVVVSWGTGYFWALYKDTRIEVTGIQRNDIVRKIPEELEDFELKDKLPFYVDGLILPINESVSRVFTLDAFHPNVDNDAYDLITPMGDSISVRAVCIGDLSGKPWQVVADGVENMLRRVNLSSAYGGHATYVAEQLWEYLTDRDDLKEIPAWEV